MVFDVRMDNLLHYLRFAQQTSSLYRVDRSLSASCYQGSYTYAIATVTREGDRLFAQLTRQRKFEIFPQSETEFFWQAVDAQVTFVKSESGRVVKAIHRQSGKEFEAPKIK